MSWPENRGHWSLKVIGTDTLSIRHLWIPINVP